MNKPWLNIQVLPHKNGIKLRPKLYPNYIKALCAHNAQYFKSTIQLQKI